MAKITYIEATGNRHEVEVEEGMNLMEGATLNMVPGIEGQCGGICSCATCHCYIPERYASLLNDKELGEVEMLKMANNVNENSRLACQLVVTEAMDGMEVELPEQQG